MPSADDGQRAVTLRIHPDRRVEVDPPDDRFAAPPPPPNTPWIYLRDATRALRDCGSAAVLYEGWRGEDGRKPQAGFAYLRGPERRVELARTSILFSAFAAEAYVNAFLGERLGEDEFEAAERDRTIDKFVIHVGRADNTVRFEKGREPGQALVKLFRTRNWLVHPKARVAPTDELTPELAAESLVAVAEAARQMTAALGTVEPHAWAVAEERELFLRWGQLCSARIPELDEDPPPDLFMLALNRQIGPQLHAHMERRRGR